MHRYGRGRGEYAIRAILHEGDRVMHEENRRFGTVRSVDGKSGKVTVLWDGNKSTDWLSVEDVLWTPKAPFKPKCPACGKGHHIDDHPFGKK